VILECLLPGTDGRTDREACTLLAPPVHAPVLAAGAGFLNSKFKMIIAFLNRESTEAASLAARACIHA
jgi:hypothetical protein